MPEVQISQVKLPEVSPRHFLFKEIIGTEVCVQILREHSAVHKIDTLIGLSLTEWMWWDAE